MLPDISPFINNVSDTYYELPCDTEYPYDE